MSVRIPGRITTISESSAGGKLNTGNGDVYAGGNTQFPQLRAGQLGFEEELEESVANLYSDTSVGTLHYGWYQYVQLKSDSPVPTLGGLLFADATSLLAGTFIVTADPTNLGLVVGVNILSSWTAGRYWWMQTGGLANVLALSSLGTGSAAIGSVVISATDGAGPARGRVDVAPTTFTTVSLGKIVGHQAEVITADSKKLVNLARGYMVSLI